MSGGLPPFSSQISRHWSRRTSDVKIPASCNIRNLKLCLLCQPTVKRLKQSRPSPLQRLYTTLHRTSDHCAGPPNATGLPLAIWLGAGAHIAGTAHLAYCKNRSWWGITILRTMDEPQLLSQSDCSNNVGLPVDHDTPSQIQRRDQSSIDVPCRCSVDCGYGR